MQSHSGNWSAWYGNPSKGNFDDVATSGELHLPPVAVPASGKTVELCLGFGKVDKSYNPRNAPMPWSAPDR